MSTRPRRCDLSDFQRRPIGFLPAAGRGLRFGSSRYDKELFPLLLTDGTNVQPRPICTLSLEAIAHAGAERCVVVISPAKTELVRVLGDHQPLRLGFVVQPEPWGLPHAIALARPWLGDHDTLLALPDTIVLPRDALRELHAELVATGADVVLGVFPVDEPERLGPVDLAPDGTVLRVLDKPGTREIMNSWAIAAWAPRFTEFCTEWDASRSQPGAAERVLGRVFADAMAAGLTVRGRLFTEGTFLDIGTPLGLRRALRELADRQLVDTAQADLFRRP